MAHVLIDDSGVTIQLSLSDKILSVHGSLRVPFEHIVRAEAMDAEPWQHLWDKIVGTNAPGMKMAGTFWVDGGLAFMDYSSGKGCLSITTTHERYKSIIVQPDEGEDADKLADAINARIVSR